MPICQYRVIAAAYCLRNQSTMPLSHIPLPADAQSAQEVHPLPSLHAYQHQTAQAENSTGSCDLCSACSVALLFCILGYEGFGLLIFCTGGDMSCLYSICFLSLVLPYVLHCLPYPQHDSEDPCLPYSPHDSEDSSSLEVMVKCRLINTIYMQPTRASQTTASNCQ